MTEDPPRQRQRQPKATAAEVAACQFSSWYSTFRNMNNRLPDDSEDGSSRTQGASTERKFRRNNVTIESRILSPLPPEFLDYLTGDGVVLPTCARKVSSCMKNDVDVEEDDDWSSSDENDAKTKNDDDSKERDNHSDNDEEDEDEDHPTMKSYHFPALTSQIQNAINELGRTTASGGSAGGGVLPKLNWSSPRDATWMNCGTLKCQTPGDVYLLLKSSEFVAFDLEKAWEDLDSDLDLDSDSGGNPAEECQEKKEGNDDEQNTNGETKAPINFRYELVLRKWCNLHPSMEFRCFVYEHELVAISQRHHSKFYNHLQHPSVTDDGRDHDNNTSSTSSNDCNVEHEKNIPATSPSAYPITPHPIAIQIQKFFRTYIRHRFPNANGNTSSFHKYVVDVYIDSQDRVWIIDFNVWADRTESLLFSWEELMELGHTMTNFKKNLAINNDEWKINANNDTESNEAKTISDSDAIMIPPPEMRVVTRDMKSMTYDPLSIFRGPTDVMDLMGGNGGASEEFEEFMKQCVKPSEM
mmetsp:Transcript_26549/g.56458  ORF Transcript_26549/g.56458 Transcript_26549/m.56458 type:complete len:526 (+) Transcript_26549:60-1637(+)